MSGSKSPGGFGFATIRLLVDDYRSLVFGLWSLVFGLWSLALALVKDATALRRGVSRWLLQKDRLFSSKMPRPCAVEFHACC
jgi:hypothetical protein